MYQRTIHHPTENKNITSNNSNYSGSTNSDNSNTSDVKDEYKLPTVEEDLQKLGIDPNEDYLGNTVQYGIQILNEISEERQKRWEKEEKKRELEEEKERKQNAKYAELAQEVINDWTSCAESGNVYCMYIVGSNYKFVDKNKARYWLEKAAAQGSSDACQSMSYLITDFKDANHTDESIQWLEKAAELGDYSVAYSLARNYFCYKSSGFYNVEKTFKYFKMAADHGVEEAIVAMGSIHAGEKLYIAKPAAYVDYEKAMKYYQTAAKLNDSRVSPRALSGIGKLYNEGKGVEKDKKKAEEYFKAYEKLKKELGTQYYLYAIVDISTTEKFFTPIYTIFVNEENKYVEKEMAEKALEKQIRNTDPNLKNVTISIVNSEYLSDAKYWQKFHIRGSSYTQKIYFMDKLEFNFDKRVK